MITVDTELGTITVLENVISSIVLDVVESFEGKVILSNSKGKISKFPYYIGNTNEIEHMKVELTEDGLNIRLYVVLKFGTSIKNTTRRMIDEIHSLVKERAGMKVNKVSILITGMVSKKIAPRHIEVNG